MPAQHLLQSVFKQVKLTVGLDEALDVSR